MATAKRVLATFVSAMEHDTDAALEKYLEKHKKADPANHTVKKKPKSKKNSPASGSLGTRATTELTGVFKPSDQVLNAVVEANKAGFDEIDSGADKAVESFKTTKAKIMLDHETEDPDSDQTDYLAQTWPKLSQAEKRIHVVGHKVGEKFETALTRGEKKLHDLYLHDWHTSATSFDHKGNDRPEDFVHTSQELQGLLSAMGVSGHPAPEDEAAEKASKGGLSKARSKAAKDHRLTGYVKKMYDYQQAYFRNAGLKEITLYRGVKGDETDGAADGSSVKVQSRELASFTADPNIAKRFGRVIEFKVPVERVFASSLVRPLIGSEAGEHTSGEAEFLIMGASDLEGRTLGKPRGKTASEMIEVPITDENADWLQHTRKTQRKSVAARVLARYLNAKGPSLTPDYLAARKHLQEGDRGPMLEFAKRVKEIIMPNGERPQWHTGLSVRQKNAIYQLYREAEEVVGQFSGGNRAPGSEEVINQYVLRGTEGWIRSLRALDVGVALADQESEIAHGQFAVVPVPGITKRQLQGALAALDEAAKKISAKFPQVLYGKVYLSKTLGKKASGHYIPSLDAMALSLAAKYRFADVYTLVHEFGHRHDVKFLSQKGRREYWALSTRRENPLHVTNYGATKGAVENYAEGFAHFVLDMDMPTELAAILAEESK